MPGFPGIIIGKCQDFLVAKCGKGLADPIAFLNTI